MRVIIGVLSLSLVALTGCQPQNPDVNVEKSWVRLSAVPDQPAAAYFTLTGGASDDSLVAIHADTVQRTELHETMVGMKGMSTMAPLERVALPAHTTVVFAPDGRHAMLFGVNPGVKPGQKMVLTYVFKSGVLLDDSARVIAAGAPAPKF